jgi:UPF0755 protein
MNEDFLGRRGVRRKKNNSFAKAFLVLLVIFAIGILGSYLWWKSELAPVNKADASTKTFVINSGEGIRTIASHLESAGLIRNQLAFFLLVRELGLNGKLQAGEFFLSSNMSAREIAENLKTGTFDVWVSIPEGKRADEIADILKQSLPSYQESWRQVLDQNEGYLFPSRYRLPRDASLELVLSTFKKQFDSNYTSIADGEKRDLSEKDIVTIASLVEREAKYAEDRPLVASVILNRLSIGMALQMDSTVEYALGYQTAEQTWWKKDLSAYDLQFNSPYNTYLSPGLPPGPIANPGHDALAAVVNAPKTNYLYYISDKSGHNHYAETLDQHNANIRKYGI